MLFFSCTNDEIALENNKTISDSTLKQQIGNSPLLYSQSELIIQYKHGTPDTTKNMLRRFYSVFSYETCHRCPDRNIEKWFFGGNIDIEPKKQAIEDGDDIPGIYSNAILDVDYEFTFSLDMDSSYMGTDIDFSYESYIKPYNNGITIAVLDTGIDTNLPLFKDGITPSKFLYKAPDYEEGLSGWDFVNTDHNSYDDNLGKHGTIVTSIIVRRLKSLGINHQILPLKVCDNNGETKYFGLVCALNDALNKADIVQMSLGWYDDGFGDFTNTIFSNLLNEHSDVMVVASAGNSNNNNDSTFHYPSSYKHNNIIAVAATNSDFSGVAWFSNYGANNVDYYAPGEDILFEGYNVDGTSFAAPVVAAEIAKIINFDPYASPDSIINQLNLSAIDCPLSFFEGKPTKYNKVINP